MRYLLDTHVFLWVVTDDPRLSKPARSRLQEADTLYVSAASFWEISIKSALGKIHADVHELIKSLSPSGLTELSITVHHAARVEALPHHHADPFDRLLIAQAQSEPLYLLTADRTLAQYGEMVVLI
jgi:PIN domain nuclease of toxin-antitoxin system